MYMVHTGRCPPYLKDFLHPRSSSSGRCGLRSATTAQYVKPRLRTVFGERAFSFTGPKSWNDLPSLLHIVTSTDSFKQQLKTYLFNTLQSSIRFYSLLWSDCLMRRWTFYCNWRTTSFYCIVLYFCMFKDPRSWLLTICSSLSLSQCLTSCRHSNVHCQYLLRV